MRRECQESCRVCQSAPSSHLYRRPRNCLADDQECTNYNSLCGVWAWMGRCTAGAGSSARQVLATCPLACAVCIPADAGISEVGTWGVQGVHHVSRSAWVKTDAASRRISTDVSFAVLLAAAPKRCEVHSVPLYPPGLRYSLTVISPQINIVSRRDALRPRRRFMS
jgi:hypothetical protein